jgi:hypothetical protein
MMLCSPSAASVRNQSTIIGPKTRPMRAVPRRWNRNRPTSSPTAIGTIHFSNRGVATDRPSTAESTEIAGVIRASP